MKTTSNRGISPVCSLFTECTVCTVSTLYMCTQPTLYTAFIKVSVKRFGESQCPLAMLARPGCGTCVGVLWCDVVGWVLCGVVVGVVCVLLGSMLRLNPCMSSLHFG